MKKVSIITTVYNCSRNLSLCLDSLIKQTYPDLELLVVDYGSTDGTRAICEDYAQQDSRIKLIFQEQGCLNAARNAGLAAATGDYLLFVESNDYLASTAVERSLNIAEKTSSDIVIFEWYQKTAQEICPAPLTCKIRNVHYSLLGNILYSRLPAYAWNKLYSRSLWLEHSFAAHKREADEATIKKVCQQAHNIFYLPALLYYHTTDKPLAKPNRSSSCTLMKKAKLLVNSILHF